MARSDNRVVGCLGCPVSLHDVRDVDGYVAAAVRRLGVPLSPCKRDELEAEGYAILWGLEADWDRERWVSFAAFVGGVFHFRLRDALDDMQGLVRPRAADGTRRRVNPWTSLDALLADPFFDESRVRPMAQFARPALAV